MTKIMLVEDDKSLREIYGIRLVAEGYEIVSAGDGEEALAMAVKEHPDLILADVMMPKISGFDMLDILRSTPETKDVKVVMMTALSSEDQRARGEALGANRYLVKSQVGIEDVVRTIHEVLLEETIAPKPTIAPQLTPEIPQPIVQPQQAAVPPSNQYQADPSPTLTPYPGPTTTSPREMSAQRYQVTPQARPEPYSPPAATAQAITPNSTGSLPENLNTNPVQPNPPMPPIQ